MGDGFAWAEPGEVRCVRDFRPRDGQGRRDAQGAQFAIQRRSLLHGLESRRRPVGGGDWFVSAAVWDVATERKLLSLRCGELVARSPDGHRIATAGMNKPLSHAIRIENLDGERLPSVVGVEHNGIRTLAWSPDGRRMASAGIDGVIKVWNIGSAEPLNLIGHSNALARVSWSPDGRRMASASFDGTVKIWDSAVGRELLSLRAHGQGVTSVAWSPDGRRIASTGGDGTIKIWGRISRV